MYVWPAPVFWQKVLGILTPYPLLALVLAAAALLCAFLVMARLAQRLPVVLVPYCTFLRDRCDVVDYRSRYGKTSYTAMNAERIGEQVERSALAPLRTVVQCAVICLPARMGLAFRQPGPSLRLLYPRHL